MSKTSMGKSWQPSRQDEDFLSSALVSGRRAQFLSPPNPAVGCVLVTGDVEIGAGHTQETGGPHAEVMALRDAQARGRSTRGATAYVTLEPCSHYGRTPPCAKGLIDAGIARVVIAQPDPNPLVAGQGAGLLRAAGIQVDVLPADHALAEQAWEDNIGFFSRMKRQRPWVRLKVAASLDGRTALGSGESKWITGEAARADGQAWRARAGAVLTGIGTVLDDDPRLDVRAIDTNRQPLRVVLDSHWRIPGSSRILAPPGQALVYGLSRPGESGLGGMSGHGGHPAHGVGTARQTLHEQGAQTAEAPADAAGRHIDIGAVLSDLAQRGVNELHVEAGARLNGAFIAEGWVDEVLIYLAPKLIGQGRGMVDLSPLARLTDAPALRIRELRMVGEDIRVVARFPGRDRF